MNSEVSDFFLPKNEEEKNHSKKKIFKKEKKFNETVITYILKIQLIYMILFIASNLPERAFPTCCKFPALVFIQNKN